MVHFGEFLKICSLRSNCVTRQVAFNQTKNLYKNFPKIPGKALAGLNPTQLLYCY